MFVLAGERTAAAVHAQGGVRNGTRLAVWRGSLQLRRVPQGGIHRTVMWDLCPHSPVSYYSGFLLLRCLFVFHLAWFPNAAGAMMVFNMVMKANAPEGQAGAAPAARPGGAPAAGGGGPRR